MFKRVVLALVAAVGMWAGSAQAQVDPNGGGGFGPGGFQMDPAMQKQIEQMQAMGQQIMENMQNSGVDPQQFFQEQFQNVPQDGSADPQAMMQSMQQAMVDKGFMTADQATQMTNVMNNIQQGFEQQMQNNPDFQNYRQNMLLNNIRQQLNVVSDDEWNVLQPKIQRVLSALADVQQNNNGQMSTGVVLGSNTFGGGNRFGAAGGGAVAAGGVTPAAVGNNPQAATETPIAKAWRELCEIVQDARTSESEVALKLSTWRTLHQHAASTLEASRTDLLQVLTLRQEAVLLWMGVL